MRLSNSKEDNMILASRKMLPSSHGPQASIELAPTANIIITTAYARTIYGIRNNVIASKLTYNTINKTRSPTVDVGKEIPMSTIPRRQLTLKTVRMNCSRHSLKLNGDWASELIGELFLSII